MFKPFHPQTFEQHAQPHQLKAGNRSPIMHVF